MTCATVIRENADGSRILLQDVASVTDGLTEATTYNRHQWHAGHRPADRESRAMRTPWR
jgi:hypothetical protein